MGGGTDAAARRPYLGLGGGGCYCVLLRVTGCYGLAEARGEDILRCQLSRNHSDWVGRNQSRSKKRFSLVIGCDGLWWVVMTLGRELGCPKLSQPGLAICPKLSQPITGEVAFRGRKKGEKFMDVATGETRRVTSDE